MYLARNKAKVNVFRQTNPRKFSRASVLAWTWWWKKEKKKEGRRNLLKNSWGKKGKISSSPSFPFFFFFFYFFFLFWTVCISFGYYMHILLPSIRSLPSKFPRRAYAILNRACNFNPPSLPSTHRCYPLEAALAALLLSLPYFYRSETETARDWLRKAPLVYVAHREIHRVN